MQGLGAYATVLREPGALAFSLVGVVARLPISMLGIGIVLLVERETGSYGVPPGPSRPSRSSAPQPAGRCRRGLPTGSARPSCWSPPC